MAAEASRNLLFGVLALQMDFIRRDQLVAATSVWLADKSKLIEDILVEQKALSADDRGLLTPLVERHIECHGGDAEKSLASLENVDPSIRQELGQFDDADVEASLTIVVAGDHTMDTLATRPPGEQLSSSGSRYRVLRPHAMGGLGQVSIARDEELNREIALKEIQERFANDLDSQSRFVLEAEVTGGLEHPGIVPVYGLGRYDDGRPYYAMRYISGDNLKEAADRFHQRAEQSGTADEHGDSNSQARGEFDSMQFRNLLGRFVDVCNAIDYAHSRGVLHRDIKPGNIMLGKYGETLVVDWGLAKVKGRDDTAKVKGETTLAPRSDSGSMPTQMGRAIGTPAYMPPEQAAGQLDELGPASDVYSLGATLYYLLTGQPPIEGSNLFEMLKKVQAGDFPPPRSLRKDVPKPLEALCLQAMALRPTDRYATANELASDIERWLADEPVSCMDEAFSVRARRWMKRHRTIVTSVAATGAVLAVSLIAGFALLTVEKSKTDAANRNLAAEKQKADEANNRLQTANEDLTAAKRSADEAAAKEREAREQALANLYATSIRLAQQEWQASKIARVEQLLNESPPEYRDWEWHYLQSLIHSEEMHLRGHTGQVDVVGFQEDGVHLVSHATDNLVKVWDLNTRQEVDSKAVPAVSKASFGGANRLMARQFGREVRVVDIVDGSVVSKVPLPAGNHTLEKAALSADGSTLALQIVPPPDGETSRIVTVFDLKSGSQIAELQDVEGGGEHDPALSRDGRLFAGALGPNAVGIWSAQSGALVHTLLGHVLPISSIAFNHDGTQLVSGGYEGVAKLWDLETGEEKATLLGHVDWILGVRFSDDGKWVISAGKDRTARIWDVSSGTELATIRGNTSYVIDAVLSHDNQRLATAAADHVIRVWDVKDLTSIEEGIPKEDFEELMGQFSLTPDHQAEVMNGFRRMVYDHASQEWKSHYGHRGPLTDVEFFPDSHRFVTAGRDDRLLIWSTRQTKPLKMYDAPGRAVDVATSPDGKTFAVAVTQGGDHSVFVWRTDSDEPVFKFKGPIDTSVRVAISPDGKYLAAGGASLSNQATGNVEIIVWELETGKEVSKISGHHGIVQALAFSHDSQSILAADTAAMTARWSLDPAEQPLWKMGVNTSGIAFHPHRDVFASTHIDGRIRIWDATTQERLADLEGPRTPLVKLAYSPNGRRLVSCGDDAAITVWDPETRLKLLELKGHANTVFGVAFSPNGRYIASAGYDGTVNIWDSGKSLATSQGDWPVVLQESFDDPEQFDTAWNPQTGQWSIEDGQLAGVLEPVNQSGQNFSVALIDHQQRFPEDVELAFDFLSTEPTGIEAGFYDGDEHVLEVELLSVENPFLLMKGALMWTRMGGNNYGQHGVNKAFEMPVGERVRVRLRREGDDFTAFVNDVQVTNVRIRTRRLPYLLFQGIYGPNGSKFYIDNVVVRAPEWASRKLLAEELIDVLFDKLLLAEDVREEVNSRQDLSAEMKTFALSLIDGHMPATPRVLAERGRLFTGKEAPTEQDLRQGVRYFQEAVRQAPMNGYFNTILGEASFELGDYPVALKSLETAAELRRSQRGSATPHQMAMLAVCHFELGSLEKASALAQQFDDCMRLAHWREKLERWRLESQLWLDKLQEVPRPQRTAEVNEVIDTVLAAQEAFMYDRNVDAYFDMCTDNYIRIAANVHAPSPADRRFTGESARDIVSIWLRRPAEKDATEVLPQKISVSLREGAARVDMRVVRVTGSQFIDFGQQIALVREQDSWKIRGNRSWHNRAQFSSSGGVINYGPEHFQALKDQLPADPQATREHIGQLVRGKDFARALTLAQELTAAEPDNPNHWLDLWAAAEGAGNVDEGLRGLSNIVARAPGVILYQDECVQLMAVTGREAQFVEFFQQLPVDETLGWLPRTRALRLYYDRLVELGRLSPEEALQQQQQRIAEVAEKESVGEAGLEQLKASLAKRQAWRLVGVFAAKSGRAALDKEFLPERDPLGLTDEEQEELRSKTKHVEASVGQYIDLLSTIERTANVAAYGVLHIESPLEQDATLLVGSDDGVKVWLNEEVVHEFNGGRAFSVARDRKPVKLQAGENIIMVKVSQDAGNWGFALELIDEDGLPIP